MSNSTLLFLELMPFSCGSDNFPQCRIALWLWKICPVILLILGTVGNSLNCVVLTRHRMRKYSTTMFLIFLAVSDCVFLWTMIGRYALLVYRNTEISDLSIFNCVMYDWFTYASGGFSVWLLVLMTLERMAFTKWPIIAKTKITPRITLVASSVLLVTISLFCCPLLFFFKIDDVHTDSKSVKKCLFVSSRAKQIRTTTWTVLSYVFLNVFPIILVVIGNTVIVATLKLQNKRIQPGQTSQQTTVASSKQRNSATKMLFVLSAFFILTTAPFCILSLVLIEATNDLTPQRFANLQLANAVTVILLLCNYTFNFYLYFISGSVFKQEWNKIVGEFKTRITKVYYDCRGIERQTVDRHIENTTRATSVI